VSVRAALRMQVRIKTGQQLILAGEMLEAGTVELEQMLRRELDENPALEIVGDLAAGMRRSWESERRAAGGVTDRGAPLDELDERRPAGQPALQLLAGQLRLLVDKDERGPALLLLYSLDERGYLPDEPQALAAELGIDPVLAKRLVGAIQALEPAGLGARNLRECLLLQCRALEEAGQGCAVARRILEAAWDDASAGRWERGARRLRLDADELQVARAFIARRLHPHPLQLAPCELDPAPRLGPPDVIFHRQAGPEIRFIAELPMADAFDLRISRAFGRALATLPGGAQRDWTAAQVERARLVVQSLRQRWITLERIAAYLAEFQRDYLETGKTALKPLTRSAAAAALGLHESTVSRSVAGKVAQLPNGRLVELAEFFNSNQPLKAALQQLLEGSPGLLSDRQLSEMLAARGFMVARRTVAK